MSRRLAKLALALSLLAAPFSTASAGFAQPPDGAPTAPIRIAPAEDTRMEVPRISDRARARLKTILARRRAHNLKSFTAYVTRGKYPHNYVTPDRLNVWIDEDGRMCAAATMIFNSSRSMRPLVRQVAKQSNYIRLADVTDGPLLDWILTSGLTHAEVVAIQEPFDGPDDPRMRREPADWKTAEDARLRARYAVVLKQLADDRAASLDAAIDALAMRPDLVAKLLGA